MVHTSGSMIFWLLFGFFLIFIGFLSIFTGFAQIITAEDVTFLVQIEDMLFVERTVSESSMIFSGVVRIVLGFFFIIIGNSFMLRGGLHSCFCHPRMGDFRSVREL